MIPNAETAVKIAEAVLTPAYGAQLVREEEPFRAVVKGDVWTVYGTLHCDGNGGGPCAGGAAIVTLSKHDGRILTMIATQ
jgi:hypothetical protein